MDYKHDLLLQIKGLLAEEFGERLAGVVLFGSEATGVSSKDSDIDMLVLLKGPVLLGTDLDRIISATYPVQLTCSRALHLIPADADDFRDGKASLYRAAKREGVFA
jgi:predicted nucleotidyltransferase